MRTASTAELNSSRGIVTGLIGATRDFAKTKLTEGVPEESYKRAYEHTP